MNKTAERYFTTDVVGGAVSPSATGALANLGLDAARTVTVENRAWTDGFDTDQFREYEVVVARPIEQTYVIDGDEYTFKKPAEELRDAAWTFDNAPHPLGHPDTGVVRSPSDIHGFHEAPKFIENYDADGDALVTRLYIPEGDEQAMEYIEDSRAVSVGFHNKLDWDVDEDGVDAYQRSIVGDHIASVKRGRCSVEDGCGIQMTSMSPVGEHDSVHGGGNEDGSHGDMTPEYDEGDWVEWSWQGGTAIGRITNVSTERELSSSGATRDPTEEGEPVYKIEHWDEEAEEFGNMKVAYESNLSSTSDPTTDHDADASCVCGSDTTADAYASTGEQKVERLQEEHLYETEEDARAAAADLGCEGVHEHEMDGETMYMPCASMESLVELANDTVCSAGPCSCGLHTDEKHGESGSDMSVEDVDLDVPDSAQSAAQAFLDAKEEGLVPDSCGTGTGTESARMIADNDVTHDRVENDIAPYLTSHEEDVERDDHPNSWPEDAWSDCGDAQYAAWGWTSLLAWAQRKADAIKRAKGEDTVYDSDCGCDTTHDATTVMDTITYEGTMGGDLDESAIPSEGFEAHYVFDGDTKSDSSYPLVDADGNLRRGNVESAYNLRGHADDEDFLMDVLMEVNDEFDDPPIDMDDDEDAMHGNEEDDTDSKHMSNDDDPPAIGGLTIDAIAEQNEEVATLQDEAAVLEDKVATLEDEVATLEDELEAYRTEERRALVDEIQDLTSAWDEEELTDLDLDALEQRLQVARDAVSGTPTSPSGDADEAETNTDNEPEQSTDDGLTVSMDARSWG